MMYRLIRFVLGLSLRGFFRTVSVQGIDRIPRSGPVLLISNHANAFVDPLLVLVSVQRRITLTAKSTLLGHPLLAPLIRAVGVVLLHRAQDVAHGADPRANVEALATLARTLRRGGAVYLFPEGQSHSDPGLRPFRTGAARVALDVVGDGAGEADLAIVPIGLHFEQKERWRSEAIALVGQARSARAWRREHPEADARALTRAMEAWVREITLNTDRDEDRRLLVGAAGLLEGVDARPPMLGQEPPWAAEAHVARAHRLLEGARWLAQHRPYALADLRARVAGLTERLDGLGLRPEELNLDLGWGRAAFFVVRELELLLVGAPLALWGWLNHLPALLTVKALVRRMSTELDQWASNAVFAAPPVFAAFYALQVGAAFLLLPGAWALAYALSLPLTGWVALLYRDRAGGARRRTRTFLRLRSRPAELDALAGELRDLALAVSALELEIPDDADRHDL